MEQALFFTFAPVVTLVLAVIIVIFGYRALLNSGKTFERKMNNIILLGASALMIWFLLYWVTYIILFVFLPLLVFILGVGVIVWGVLYVKRWKKQRDTRLTTSSSSGGSPLL